VEPISQKYNVEIGGKIQATRRGYRYARPFVGIRGKMPGMSHMVNFVAGYHTHPNGTSFFSFGDVSWVRDTQSTLYVRGGGVTRACDYGSFSCNYDNVIVNKENSSNRALKGRPIR